MEILRNWVIRNHLHIYSMHGNFICVEGNGLSMYTERFVINSQYERK